MHGVKMVIVKLIGSSRQTLPSQSSSSQSYPQLKHHDIKIATPSSWPLPLVNNAHKTTIVKTTAIKFITVSGRPSLDPYQFGCSTIQVWLHDGEGKAATKSRSSRSTPDFCPSKEILSYSRLAQTRSSRRVQVNQSLVSLTIKVVATSSQSHPTRTSRTT